MKQTMKRVKLATFSILAAGMMLFTGCGAAQVTGKCSACKQEKPLYEATFKVEAMGASQTKTYTLCKDCMNATEKATRSQASGVGARVTVTSKPKTEK